MKKEDEDERASVSTSQRLKKHETERGERKMRERREWENREKQEGWKRQEDCYNFLSMAVLGVQFRERKNRGRDRGKTEKWRERRGERESGFGEMIESCMKLRTIKAENIFVPRWSQKVTFTYCFSFVSLSLFCHFFLSLTFPLFSLLSLREKDSRLSPVILPNSDISFLSCTFTRLEIALSSSNHKSLLLTSFSDFLSPQLFTFSLSDTFLSLWYFSLSLRYFFFQIFPKKFFYFRGKEEKNASFSDFEMLKIAPAWWAHQISFYLEQNQEMKNK